MIKMIEDKLELVLITYNRFKDLDNTLKQLLESPFSKCKITILDNCSDDETPRVCNKYKRLFQNMNIVRHLKNIGGNANFLRAVETSRSEYTWIVCDDDNYNFSDCIDVIKAIDSEKFDIVSLGEPGQYEWERGLKTTSKELIEKGSKYYSVLSFVPGFIFRTELFDSSCIFRGYVNIHNIYPHFPFINKSVEENFSIYISKKEIIKSGTENQSSFSVLFWMKSWISSCEMIKDKKIRRKIIYEDITGVSFLKRVIFSISSEKINDNNSKVMIEFLASFINSFRFSKDELFLILIVPLIIMPACFYKPLWVFYRFIQFKILKKGEFNRGSEKKEIDPFR
jgi:glycosyltransferase involved in cell wall biosynthesis